MLRILRAIKSRIRSVYNKLRPFPSLEKRTTNGKLRISHVSAFNYGNAGDTLLPLVLRDLFNDGSSIKGWSSVPVYYRVDDKLINGINSTDAMIIGGGGLFLKDTNANNISGWQWACSIDAINAIKVPGIMFAVGYNRFRGQEDFEPYFTDNLNAFVKKASFVGLRNHGSIQNVKCYLKSDELKDKIVYQPCMTTVIANIYPDFTDYSKKEDFVVFNCAFDRSDKRSISEDTLRQIARVACDLSKITKVKYYAHMTTDCNVLKYFDELNFPYELVHLKDVKQIVKAYATPRLVIGMRGHAQMIPFGCQTPILSIVSHDKMQWFIDDINHSDWGVELNDPNFENLLLTRATDAYNNYQERHEQVKEEQLKLWNITQKNINKINSIIL